MTGPVGISEAVSKTEGIKEFVYMLALISISLGVTNLLPIPALDGGKILILIIEAIRRKPLKEETEIKIQLLGFSLLIALSLYVTYNDIVRLSIGVAGIRDEESVQDLMNKCDQRMYISKRDGKGRITY